LKPVWFTPDQITLPPFIPQTQIAHEEVARQYTAVNRMDQGIGLIMEQLKNLGLLEDTLVIYFSDNGPPYPGAKTNLYDPGMAEPLIVSSPDQKTHGTRTTGMVSSLDIVPSILDWTGISFPKYKLNGVDVMLTGKTFLSLLDNPSADEDFDHVFASHITHEATMYYPIRVIRDKNFKLIYNIAYYLPYPIAYDLYTSATYQQLLNNSMEGKPTFWNRDFF